MNMHEVSEKLTLMSLSHFSYLMHCIVNTFASSLHLYSTVNVENIFVCQIIAIFSIKVPHVQFTLSLEDLSNLLKNRYHEEKKNIKKAFILDE